MKITLAQLNPIVGDISGNLEKVFSTMKNLASEKPDLVVFPELFLTGYPPRDLLERKAFLARCSKAIELLIEESIKYSETAIIMGVPWPSDREFGKRLYNSALMIFRGEILLNQHKSLLPTYDVFDESRYFDAAKEIYTIPFKGEVLGISICEDMWNDPELWVNRNYPKDPVRELNNSGATIHLNISASPFDLGKEIIRFKIVENHVKKYKTPFVFVNQVGANDELIFDGRSMYMDASGNLKTLLPSFSEGIVTIDTDLHDDSRVFIKENRLKDLHDALTLGVRDYFRKCGFKKAVIGLSGGIDSAVTCAIAQIALGSENVLGITMPSPYSSRGSVDDSRKLADNLGIEIKTIPISDIYSSYRHTLDPFFLHLEEDTTEENIQARIRGNLLMAFSNKFGHLVLSTGNKSELAVGYCTLYGDMAGGLAVISDVPKTMVYELAEYINREKEIIPRATIDKPPSAELKPDQTDQDSLPPYDVLDELLHCYVDLGYSASKMEDLEYDNEIIRWVIRAVDRNEYKRHQAAPGLKVTSKAFGVGRRMPIAAKYD